jgi:tetraacyldisaccharide 4'-kinase
MRERFFLSVISGERKGLAAALLRPVLRILSVFYGILAGLRRIAYALRLRPRRKADVPVISIGNITAGGTGKTPLVAYLANMLKRAGRTPAILSRGYKSAGGVSDEAEVLQRAAPGVPHIRGKDRVASAKKAVKGYSADCLVLDDGFQHWRLERDCDIVTIDALNPFGYGRLLPSGLLREPLDALKRADAFVVTHADQVGTDKVDVLVTTLRRLAPDAPVATGAHRVTELVRASDGVSKKPKNMKGKKVLAFCGIGNPRSFKATLRELGVEVKMFLAFKDHQHYPPFLLKKIEKAVTTLNVDAICTTEKDAVKISSWEWPKPCYQVRVAFEFIGGESEIEKLVLSAVNRGRVDCGDKREIINARNTDKTR